MSVKKESRNLNDSASKRDSEKLQSETKDRKILKKMPEEPAKIRIVPPQNAFLQQKQNSQKNDESVQIVVQEHDGRQDGGENGLEKALIRFPDKI